jgi:hypothetical protein
MWLLVCIVLVLICSLACGKTYVIAQRAIKQPYRTVVVKLPFLYFSRQYLITDRYLPHTSPKLVPLTSVGLHLEGQTILTMRSSFLTKHESPLVNRDHPERLPDCR